MLLPSVAVIFALRLRLVRVIYASRVICVLRTRDIFAIAKVKETICKQIVNLWYAVLTKTAQSDVFDVGGMR